MELDWGGELALGQMDISAAFERVNHGGLVFKLKEAGIGGMNLKGLQNYLSSRTQRVKIDGVCSSSVDVVSGIPQKSMCSYSFVVFTVGTLLTNFAGLFKNVLVGYADDSTLFCRIPHPRDRAPVPCIIE